jgi:uncharacterized membrane protein
MQRSQTFVMFVLFVVCAAGFVWMTSDSLPALVASHFGVSGTADRFMPRDAYVRFMLAFVVVLPLFIVGLTTLILGSPNARINVPNREYWLAPERREETVSFLRLHTLRFGGMLVVFLCYVHWLVVRANEAQPVRLDSRWFIGGLAVFLVFALGWAKVLIGRFRQVP